MHKIFFPERGTLEIPLDVEQRRTVAVRLRTIARSTLDPEAPGGEHAATEFLVAPDTTPTIGSRLRTGGREYVIATVRECRDIAGRLIACRCAARS